MFGRSKAQSEATASDASTSVASEGEAVQEAAVAPAMDEPRLPGLPAEAARLLPYLTAEPPCSACGSVMTLQGRAQQPGPCNSCSASSAAEPLGICHMCLTCGRRLCAGCSQNEAIRRRTEIAMQSAQRQAAEAADSYAAETAEAARKQKRASSELQDSRAQQATARSEAAAEKASASLHKETLTREVQAEREALDRQIAEAERHLEDRDRAVRQARSRLRELQAELAAAPRPSIDVPDDQAELREARAEVASFRALASEREKQAAEHQAEAEKAAALEQRLRVELENLRVSHAEKRGKRLATLAIARAELNVERRAAEEVVETELAEAQAEEEARQRRAVAAEEEEQRARAASAEAAAAAEEQRRAASAASASTLTASGSTAPASAASEARGGEGVFDRFLDKLQNFVEDMDALVVPVGGDMAWGLPLEMQMGMSEYGYMTDSMMSPWNDGTTAFLPTGEPGATPPGPMDEEGQALYAERLAWERRRADCEKQLEWMQRDIERQALQADTLQAEITRLQAEHTSSRVKADELERDVHKEKERMREYHQKLRNLLLRAVASCRGRILAALRSGSTLKTSELESLFDSDWLTPPPSGSSQGNSTAGDAVGRQVSVDADLETFAASLEAMCDELERAALDAGEEARNSGMLSDAMSAFNAAADAKETAEEWPTSVGQTTSGATMSFHDEEEIAARQATAANEAEDWPEAEAPAARGSTATFSTATFAPAPRAALPASGSANSLVEESLEAATPPSPAPAEDAEEDWPEAVTSFSK